MKKSLMTALFVVICMAAALPAARAEMVYTDGGAGGGRYVPNKIDFVLQFNHQLDNSDGVNDGGGLWIGYRRMLNEFFSLGGKLGIHSFSIENGGFKDTVGSVPLLITAQVERNFDHVFTIWGQVGMGPSFNNIEGDATDLLDLKMGTSFVFDITFGGAVEINPNISIGLNFDWFLSSAPVDSPSALADDHLNISHFGIGAIFIGSF